MNTSTGDSKDLEAVGNIEGYSFFHEIGRGTYGIVYKGFDQSVCRYVAIKKVRKGSDDELGIPAATLREVSLLKGLNHPNIVSLHEVIINCSVIYIVYEYMPTDLNRYIKIIGKRALMKQHEVKLFLYQIMQAVVYCHSSHILHRDLKPHNILLDPMAKKIKITDFGLGRTKKLSRTVRTDAVTTLWYRAPEILLGAIDCNYAIDMWSVGCIFSEMSSGLALFQGDSEIDQLFKIFRILKTPTEVTWPGVTCLQQFSSKFPQWTRYCLKKNTANLDDDGYDLLQKLLTYNVKTRITARAALEHPYFNGTKELLPSCSANVYY